MHYLSMHSFVRNILEQKKPTTMMMATATMREQLVDLYQFEAHLNIR